MSSDTRTALTATGVLALAFIGTYLIFILLSGYTNVAEQSARCNRQPGKVWVVNVFTLGSTGECKQEKSIGL